MNSKQVANVSGITVKDFNYYPHLQDSQVRETICETVRSFYEDEVMGDYQGGRDCRSAPIPFPLSASIIPKLTIRYIRYSPRRPTLPSPHHRFQSIQPIIRSPLVHI
jgi:hypothetical protein